MSQPWYDLAKQTLGPDDVIEKTYSCKLENESGYLCLGSKKMVFVNVKGFLRKNYNVLLDIPYTEVNEVGLADRFSLNLVQQDKKHKIVSTDVSAKIILKGLEDVTKKSPLNPQIIFRG
jgi:hypothetical protein